MAEYIEREALKNEFHCTKEGLFFCGGKTYIDFDVVSKAVLQTPTADVVEVVRCKDCRFCYIDIFNQVCCRKSCYKETLIGVGKHDFYCADGEKGEYKLGVYKGGVGESEKSLLYADIDEIIDADYGAKIDGKDLK